MKKNIVVFKAETTGLPIWSIPSDSKDQPHIVQVAASVFSPCGGVVDDFLYTVRPNGWDIPSDSVACHGVSDEDAKISQFSEAEVVEKLFSFIDEHGGDELVMVAPNWGFFSRIMRIALKRYDPENAEFFKGAGCCVTAMAKQALGVKKLKFDEAFKLLVSNAKKDAAIPDAVGAKVSVAKAADLYFEIVGVSDS